MLLFRYWPVGLLFAAMITSPLHSADTPVSTRLFDADDKRIQYTGRIDFSNPKKPKFWTPGCYITAKFTGSFCEVILNDEHKYNKNRNYVEIVVDNLPPVRLRLAQDQSVLRVAENLSDGPHTLTLYKDTETEMGYLEFVGIRCADLLKLPAPPKRKLEFYGDSITAGASSDPSQFPCGKGEWYDQHNAFASYGSITARQLKAQSHLTAVAGIGLMHSCCDMGFTLPEVFDQINLRKNMPAWDFARYQPDAVTVCLGQNDGIQDDAAFQRNYVAFLAQLRKVYPKAEIVCLNSPMADASLTAYLKKNLPIIVEKRHAQGDERVHIFFFSRRFNSGCGDHPDVQEHQKMANELTPYLKNLLHW